MSDNDTDGCLSPEQRALCDKALLQLDLDAEAEFISIGIDMDSPDERSFLLWLTAEDGMAIGSIRLTTTRARKVAADILALATDG